MNTNIQIFSNPSFGQIRTMTMPDGQIGFAGKDVARVLGYRDTVNALKAHVDEDDKLGWQITTSGQRRTIIFINESGLYALVFASRLPQAREFKHWVTSEVLPQLRATGTYAMPTLPAGDNVTMLTHAVAGLVRRAEYAETVLLSPTCYTMTQVAKSLSMTVQELQHSLHAMHVIYRSPSGPWMLYAEHLRKGYEAYRTTTGEDRRGDVLWTESYLVWTERGKEFIHSLYRHLAA